MEELGEWLLEDGWCPSTIDAMASYASLLWYARLNGPGKRHSVYSSCTSDVCLLSQVRNDDQYQHWHVGDDCPCYFATTSMRSLLDIIESGLCPLVGGRIGSTMELKGYNLEDVKYVAVSHVWLDGCGNPTANAVPSCQADLIDAQVKMWFSQSRTESMPWFLDTLCVPVPVSQRAKAARNKLIAMMNVIYKNALIVLVRDKALVDLSSHLDPLETVFKIAFSQWSQRLWTLQEAVAATRLEFSMSDGPVSFDKLHSSLLDPILRQCRALAESDGRMLPRQSSVLAYLVEMADHIVALQRPRVVDDDFKHAAFVLCARRSTSHPEDDILCLASILRFTPAQVTKMITCSRQEGWAYLLEEIGKVPVALALSYGPRMSARGFGWCPIDVINNWGSTVAESHTVTSKGLLGTWTTVPFASRSGMRERLKSSVHSDPRQFDFRLKTSDLTFTVICVVTEVPDFLVGLEEGPLALRIPCSETKISSNIPIHGLLVRLKGLSKVKVVLGERVAPCAVDLTRTEKVRRGEIGDGRTIETKLFNSDKGIARWCID